MLRNCDLNPGAVGVSQFDVGTHRLKAKYGVDAVVEPMGAQAARWTVCKDDKELRCVHDNAHEDLADDSQLVNLPPTPVNLDPTQARWADVQFEAACEQQNPLTT